MIARFSMWALKIGAVWAGLLAGSMAGGMLGAMMFSAAAWPALRNPDGPLTPETAPLVIAGLHAALIAALAAQARLRGAALAIFLFVIFFGAQTFMMQIETVFFNETFGLSWSVIAIGVAASAISAMVGSVVAALVFRPERAEPAATPGLAWRIPVAAVVYMIAYFAAGIIIVWPNEAARAFYDDFQRFSLPWLPALQFVRGLLWALLALMVVRSLKGSLATRAVMTGLAFSAFGAAQLLYPNPVMPWPVRQLHLIEIGISNTLFGGFAALLVGGWPRLGRRMHPSPITNSTAS